MSIPLRRVLICLAGLLPLLVGGCALFPTPANESGAGLSWLTQWNTQQLDVVPGFDVETLRPSQTPPTVQPGELLEITVWDLYEPGQPYTFPVRVAEEQTVEAPLVGKVAVAGQSLAQIETSLIDAYRTGEYLVQARVLVRSLDATTVKVQVGGAVARAGFVELSRNDSSPYAAIISSGGVQKTAGTMVAVAFRANTGVEPPAATSSTGPLAARPPAVHAASVHPEGHANSVDTLSVAADVSSPESAVSYAGVVSQTVAKPVIAEQNATPRAATVVWYDLSKPADREKLRQVRLSEGDELIVKPATPPVRVGGVVERPGAYPLPAGRSLNVWQAIELAGGVRLADAPLHIALLRPAADGQPARRWVLNVEKYTEHPTGSPNVEPGDVLQIAPTTGTKLKRAVGDLWNKP